MTHLELWKLGADLLLLGALGWLSFCIARMQGGSGAANRHGVELERSLRGLIKEADLASSSLHDQLLRRQQSLERLLRDIEGVEHRVNRAVASADTRATQTPPAPPPNEQPMKASPKPTGPRDFGTPEAPSFNTVAKPSRSPAKGAAQTSVKTNIFGDPIVESRPVAEPPPVIRADQTPLTAAIERQVVPSSPPPAPPVTKTTAAESLGEIRRAAEELLRAGRDLEFVARRTNLSIDEVRLISNAVLREASNRGGSPSVGSVERFVPDETSGPAPDPRLGVLSPIRRSIETV